MISVFYDGLKDWKEKVFEKTEKLRSELKHIKKDDDIKYKILSDISIQTDLQSRLDILMEKEEKRIADM